MGTNTELEILQQLAEGKISTAEATELLDSSRAASVADDMISFETIDELKAIEDVPAISIEELKSDEPPSFKIHHQDIFPDRNDNHRPRWLKIRVSELDTDRKKVNIAIPLSLANLCWGIARRFSGEDDDTLQIDELMQTVKAGGHGLMIDVEDEDDNEHVQIYIE